MSPTDVPTWATEPEEEFQARRQRYYAACDAWHARQTLRGPSVGAWLLIAGGVVVCLSLALPYASLGRGFPVPQTMLAMILTALVGSGLVWIGARVHGAYRAKDPRPEFHRV